MNWNLRIIVWLQYGVGPPGPESPMSQVVGFGFQFMGEGHQKAFLAGHIYLRIGTGENGEY